MKIYYKYEPVTGRRETTVNGNDTDWVEYTETGKGTNLFEAQSTQAPPPRILRFFNQQTNNGKNVQSNISEAMFYIDGCCGARAKTYAQENKDSQGSEYQTKILLDQPFPFRKTGSTLASQEVRHAQKIRRERVPEKSTATHEKKDNDNGESDAGSVGSRSDESWKSYEPGMTPSLY